MTALLTLMLLTQTPALPATPPTGAADSNQSIRAARIPLELLGGTATGVAFGALATAVLCSGGACGGDENLAAVAFFALTAPLGISAGSTLVGWLLDGDGSYWMSTLGVFAGGAIDLLVVSTAHHDLGMGVDVGLIALPIVGGTVGYELSSHAHRSHAPRLSLAPTLTLGRVPSAGLALSGVF